jgi:glyoxylase-like metal-dependent hydrolase (beta-lactamase superfamily II)
MGRGYETNCYILIKDGESLVIDPGIDAAEWVARNAPKPLAILNTHGHFDHTFSNAALKRDLGAPIYIHTEDHFMLNGESYLKSKEPCIADMRVSSDDWITLGGFCFRFMHFPGHSPGCCMIEFEDRIFSGDFIFENTIGRCDFPYSSPSDMRRSLTRFLELYGADASDDRPIYPGHGKETTIQRARGFLPEFIRMLSR